MTKRPGSLGGRCRLQLFLILSVVVAFGCGPFAVVAGADSGVPLARGSVGDLRWTLYVESPGAVVGEAELGLLLVREGGGAVVPARMHASARGPDGSRQARATRPGFADNYLVHGFPLWFHEVGTWDVVFEGSVEPGAPGLRIEHRLEVGEGPSLWWRSWPALVFPALVLLLAALARRRSQST